MERSFIVVLKKISFSCYIGFLESRDLKEVSHRFLRGQQSSREKYKMPRYSRNSKEFSVAGAGVKE